MSLFRNYSGNMVEYICLYVEVIWWESCGSELVQELLGKSGGISMSLCRGGSHAGVSLFRNYSGNLVESLCLYVEVIWLESCGSELVQELLGKSGGISMSLCRGDMMGVMRE